jgi:hypothetical protein
MLAVLIFVDGYRSGVEEGISSGIGSHLGMLMPLELDII